jgi:hypothetical protein
MTEFQQPKKDVNHLTERPNEAHLDNQAARVHSKLLQDTNSVPVPTDVRTEKPVAGADALLTGIDPTSYFAHLSAKWAPRLAALANVNDPHVLRDWGAIFESCRRDDAGVRNDSLLASAQDTNLQLMQRIAKAQGLG